MEKFSMFDVISKLAPLEKAIKSLNLTPKKEDDKPQTPPPITIKKPNFAILNLLNKHSEISKRIDQNNKK